jgi:excisionase family DNA binding protein
MRFSGSGDKFLPAQWRFFNMRSSRDKKTEKVLQPVKVPPYDLALFIEQRIQTLSVSELVELARLQAEDDIIGVDEAAAILKIHPITLRKKAIAWGVPHRRLGTEWRFSRKRLMEWMQSKDIQAA